MVAVTQGSLSGNSMVNGVLWDGWKWTNSGSPIVLNYFFASDGGRAWTTVEKTAYQGALAQWASVANISFAETNSRASANLVENILTDAQMQSATGSSGVFGFHDTPEQAASAHSNNGSGYTSNLATNQAGGYYNYQSMGQTSGWTAAQLSDGGFFFRMITHELGHGLGLKHPHDIIGSAPKFPGVTNSGSLGNNNLNHMFYSIMSYNRDYDFDANGKIIVQSGNNFTVGGNDILEYGYVAGPMAFDIAGIQALYGANYSTNSGNTVYILPDSDVQGTAWRCIWDGGGIDELRYNGSRNAILDLRAATLDNTATGGGVLSYAANIHGGYTIANGVVIENATGGSGNDTITGNVASNVLTGGLGNDAIDGGAGADTSVFSGAFSSYSFTNLGGGAVRVVGPDGTDTLLNIEMLRFNDRTIHYAATGNVLVNVRDFDSNGRDDLLWRNDNTAVSIWDNGAISGAHIISQAGTVPASWQIFGKGDFDGNGKGDILWRNDNGAVSIWDNADIGGAHIIANAGVVPTSWRITGTGDFDGNSRSDILWRNDNGAVSIWDNGAIGGAHIVANAGVVATSWQIAGTGDFDGNGRSDILWRNDNGTASIWDNGDIAGAHIIAGSQNVGTSWKIAGVGDFDGNGRSDILWRNDNGTVSIWDNADIGGAHAITGSQNVGNSWHIAGVGDFDGNGHSDIVWRNDDGRASIWDDGDIAKAHIIADLGVVSAGWHIV